MTSADSTPRSVAAYARDAFTILEAEAPAAFHRLIGQLRDRSVHLSVGQEQLVLDLRDGRPVIRASGPSESPDAPMASVVTSRATVLDLIDGTLLLPQAVAERRLDVRGDTDALLRLSRALTAFVEGAVRSRSMRPLLASFREDARSCTQSCPE